MFQFHITKGLKIREDTVGVEKNGDFKRVPSKRSSITVVEDLQTPQWIIGLVQRTYVFIPEKLKYLAPKLWQGFMESSLYLLVIWMDSIKKKIHKYISRRANSLSCNYWWDLFSCAIERKSTINFHKASVDEERHQVLFDKNEKIQAAIESYQTDKYTGYAHNHLAWSSLGSI